MTRPSYLADEVPKMAAELVRLRASLSAAERRARDAEIWRDRNYARIGALEAALRALLDSTGLDAEFACRTCGQVGACAATCESKQARAALAAKEGTK
jgi:hypothetical protein